MAEQTIAYWALASMRPRSVERGKATDELIADSAVALLQ